MPYIIKGTKGILSYWNTLGRPCDIRDISAATKIPMINFLGVGRDGVSFTAQFGEVEAQAVAGVMGTTVSNLLLSGDVIQI
mgnify:CR=1 FL=1